jgi:hypothetical protein
MKIATSSPKKFKIGSALIKWYQGGTKYSHVLLINSDDMIYQASHGRVHCLHIENFLEDNKIIDIFTVSDDLLDFEFAKKQVGKKYGFMQLIRIAIKYLFGLRLIDNGNKRLICSEYVGKVLKLDWVDDYTSPEEIVKYLRKMQDEQKILFFR